MVYFLIIENPWCLCNYNWARSVHQRFLLMSVTLAVIPRSVLFKCMAPTFLLCYFFFFFNGLSGTELDSLLRNLALFIVKEIWKLIWLIVDPKELCWHWSVTLLLMWAATLCSMWSICRSTRKGRDCNSSEKPCSYLFFTCWALSQFKAMMPKGGRMLSWW